MKIVLIRVTGRGQEVIPWCWCSRWRWWWLWWSWNNVYKC